MLELELRISLSFRRSLELESSCWNHSGARGMILELGYIHLLKLELGMALCSIERTSWCSAADLLETYGSWCYRFPYALEKA